MSRQGNKVLRWVVGYIFHKVTRTELFLQIEYICSLNANVLYVDARYLNWTVISKFSNRPSCAYTFKKKGNVLDNGA